MGLGQTATTKDSVGADDLIQRPADGESPPLVRVGGQFDLGELELARTSQALPFVPNIQLLELKNKAPPLENRDHMADHRPIGPFPSPLLISRLGESAETPIPHRWRPPVEPTLTPGVHILTHCVVGNTSEVK